MIRRLYFAVALTLATTVAVPAGAGNIALGDEDDFGWALVTGGRHSMSTGRVGWDSVQELRKRYGSDLLVVSDQDETWVITDRKLVDRAQRSARKIKNMEPEIGEMAEAQAKLSLSDADHREEKERLRKKQAALRKKIRAAQDEGEPTEDLERDLFHVNVGLDAIEGMARDHRLSSAEREDLTRRRDRATVKVNAGMRKINDEIRGLLDEAKSRGLARRVND